MSTNSEAQNSGVTDEQIQLAIRLESIFMPEARKQRDELYRKQTGAVGVISRAPVRFVHYTSAEAALRIIQSKRIWMRNATCMSDYREVQHGYDILVKFFDKPGTEKFSAALDACAPGAAKEAINLFNRWWRNIRFGTYIASLSEHDSREDLHGRLSMWRAFGGNVARVAIVIKVPWFTGAADALGLIFSPVAYLMEKEAHTVAYQVIENISANCDFLRTIDRKRIVLIVFRMLLAGVTCLKHEGFREELEWRAIYSPAISPSPLMESSTEIIGGVPQLVYKVPLDAKVSPLIAALDMSQTFDRLIIGPSPYPWAMYEAFVEALKKIGVPDAEQRVFSSDIPIRS